MLILSAFRVGADDEVYLSTRHSTTTMVNAMVHTDVL